MGNMQSWFWTQGQFLGEQEIKSWDLKCKVRIQYYWAFLIKIGAQASFGNLAKKLC